MDSEDDVYIPQTNMEVEFALTVQKAQTELEKYKKENMILRQTISKLEIDRDAFQATVNKYSEITNQQVKEIIAQLKKSLKELGNKNGNRHNIHTVNYNFPSNTSNIKGITKYEDGKSKWNGVRIYIVYNKEL